MCKAYRSLVKKWHPDKHHHHHHSHKSDVHDAYKIFYEEEEKEPHFNIVHEPTTPSSGGSSHHRSSHDHHHQDGFSFKPSVLLKSLSRNSSRSTRSASSSPTELSRSRSQACSSSPPHLTRTTSKINTSSPTSSSTSHKRENRSRSAVRSRSNSVAEIPFLSRNFSRRSSTPIVFSQSTARKKPPAIEMKLECTMEELFHGSIKQILISRDTIKNGFMVEEEELLKIIVKPGWKRGTKVTFEGKGDERPGYLPADIIFIIEEISHPLFNRVGDDLEHEVELPLVKALTGCTISVPLLGGGKMSLSFEDVIYHGFEKVIKGQGMPIAKEDGKRGDLRIKFTVNFPRRLTEEKRLEASGILGDCS